MPAQRFDEMEAFVSVVEAASFSAAGRRLGVTTSAVSRSIANLERRLGVRLLNRTTRRLALTDEGDAFYRASKGILDEVEQAEQSVRNRHSTPAGTLRISVPADFARLQLAKPLVDFARKFPKISLQIDASEHLVDVVGEGFDVAVRIATLHDTSLVARRLGICRHALCATPRYLAKNGEPKKLSDLESHQWIAYEYDTWRGRSFASEPGSKALNLRGRVQTNNGDIMRRLVLADLGIASLPTFLVGNDLRAGRLKRLLPGRFDRETQIQAVYPHRNLVATKVRVFVEHLAKTCGDAPPWDRGL